MNTVKEGRLKIIVVLAALTGIRREEIINLRWENIELVREVILIESSVTYKVNAQLQRTIPLSKSVKYLLTEKVAVRASGYVFEVDGKPLGKS